jgi:adenosylmethionine-8-amino-7-oxononanoate aminotransferase
MAVVVKGMVQVEGTTYRIVRITRGHYNVVRVLDDIAVGTFSAGKTFQMTPVGIEPELLREIARVAIQGAKTTWVGRLA